MSRSRRIPSPRAIAGLVALGAACALWSAPAAGAAVPGPPWVIDDRGRSATIIAGYRLPAARPGVQGPRLAALISAWGPPAVRRAYGRQGCLVTWSRPRVQAGLANYGALPRGANACQPRHGLVQQIRTLGTAWRTREGLGVGAPRRRIMALYPRAQPAVEGDPASMILKPHLYPCPRCSGSEELFAARRGAAVAFIPRARVTRFVVPVGAAGD